MGTAGSSARRPGDNVIKNNSASFSVSLAPNQSSAIGAFFKTPSPIDSAFACLKRRNSIIITTLNAMHTSV